MSVVLLDDISMYYEIHGVGENLVFVSGLGADHSSWYEMLEKLKTRFRVLLLNTRGIEDTSVGNKPISIELLADDIVKLCKYLGIEKAHFIGHSMGGFIIQNIAYKYQSMVTSLTIMNSAMIAETSYKYYLEAYYELIKNRTDKEILGKLVLSWSFSSKFLNMPGKFDDLLKKLISKPSFGDSIDGCVQRLNAFNEFDSTLWAHQIKVPTLVISGGKDLILSDHLSEKLADKIPNAIYHCFLECGHIPHVEYFQETVELIVNFIICTKTL